MLSSQVAVAVGQRRGAAVDHRGLADEAERLGRLRGLLQRYQRRQRVVGVELLLDAGEFDQLLGELVGVERIERVLVLQLRRQQGQEALEVAGDLLRRQRVGGRGRLKLDEDEARQRRRSRNDRAGRVCAAVVVMSVSSDADVDAAARSEHAAISSSRDRGGDGVFVADDQPLRVAAVWLPLFWPEEDWSRRLNCRPLSPVLKPASFSALLQLRRVLLQHRQRFRLFDRQMRGHLAVAVDIDADIDAAEVGRIEPDFEAALAVLGRCRDLEREPAQRHGAAGRRGDGQRARRSRGGRRGRKLRLEPAPVACTPGVGGIGRRMRRRRRSPNGRGSARLRRCRCGAAEASAFAALAACCPRRPVCRRWRLLRRGGRATDRSGADAASELVGRRGCRLRRGRSLGRSVFRRNRRRRGNGRRSTSRRPSRRGRSAWPAGSTGVGDVSLAAVFAVAVVPVVVAGRRGVARLRWPRHRSWSARTTRHGGGRRLAGGNAPPPRSPAARWRCRRSALAAARRSPSARR